MDAGLGCRDR